MIFDAPRRSQITVDELGDAITNRPTPWGEYAGAVVEDAFNSSIPGTAVREFGLPQDDRMVDPNRTIGRAPPRYVRTDEPLMSEDEWKKSEFYRESIPFDSRMTRNRAKYKAEVYDDDQFRAWQRQNRPWSAGQVATAVLGSLVGSAPDPTNYIPVFGPAFKAVAAGRAANILRRAGVQAVDSAIVTAAAEPIITGSRRQFGDDVSFAEQVMDVALSGAVGGIFGGTIGWREKLPALKHGPQALQKLHAAANDVAEGRPISTPPMTAQEFTDMVRLAGADTMDRASDNLSGLVQARDGAPAFDLGRIEKATSEDIPAYVRDIVKPNSGTESAQRFTFDLGELPAPISRLVEKLSDGKTATTNRVSLSNQVIEKLYRNNPQQADELLARLPELLARPAEILPDHQNPSRLLMTSRTMPGPKGDRNNVAVMELARKADGYEVVSIHASPDRTLARARQALGEKLSAGGGAAVPSFGGASRTPPAAADFPAVTSDRPPNVGTVDEAVKAAETRLGKPLNDPRKIAAEQELNIDTGEFPELSEVEQLIKNDLVGEAERTALKEADDLAKQADNYAKAYEAAAFCLGRKG